MNLLVILFVCAFSAACGELISGLPPDATFRLVGGVTSREGRLEVFYNKSWGSICDDGFDDVAASVGCANLGFGFSGKFVENRYGPGTGPIWLDDLRCIGTEPSLAECRHNLLGVHDCAHKQDVSIVCLPIVPVELRLVGGPTPREGRLEVKYNETWGTICDDGFNDIEATIACSSLGLRNGGRFVSNTYGPGTGKIWLDNVRCIGTESSIAQCRHNGWGEHDCAHKEDVSILCMSPTTTTLASTTKTTARAVLPATIPPACHFSSSPTYINSASGWFMSPNYPSNYNNNMDCGWLIQAPFTNWLVTLTLHDVDLEYNRDWVKLYDGYTTSALLIATVANTYYSTYDLNYTTSQRYMLIRFHSDFSVTYRGFNATFSSTEARSTPAPTTTTTATLTTFNTRNNHQVLWDADGTITSPNYPLDYDPFTYVSWLIRSSDPNKVITLTFTAFRTEQYADECTIYDGEDQQSATLASLSGMDVVTYSYDSFLSFRNSRPRLTPTYTTTRNSMYITFSADGSAQYSGFLATFQIKPRIASWPTYVTSRIPYRYNDMLIYTSTTSSGNEYNLLTAPSGSFTSPRYPNFYPNNVDVSWLIAAPPNGVVTLTTVVVDLETCCDHIYLYDGDNVNAPRINRLTADTDVYKTTQRYMLVRFTSDGSIVRSGFQATYSTTKGSNNWILFATIIAVSSTSFVFGICIIAYCVRRRRLQRTCDLRRRYIALRSESDNYEELQREQNPYSSEIDKKENEQSNQQLIFVVSGNDNDDWKEAAGQDFTPDNASLHSDFLGDTYDNL